MSTPELFDVDPWGIGRTTWEQQGASHREAVFALSNGNLGWRGTLDEADPCEISGTYLNGVFERHPLPYAEQGYGYPESGETMVDVPDGKIIRLIVDDEPFDVRTGRLEHHEQYLDFRRGTLSRRVRWTSPAGASVRIESTRLVSLTHRGVAAISYRVTAVDRAVDLTVLSEIVANQPPPALHSDDRVMQALTAPFAAVGQFVVGRRATLVHRTRASGIGVSVAMDHLIDGDGQVDETTEVSADLARTTIATRLEPGRTIRIVKMVGHEWSDSATDAALRDRADAAVETAVVLGWDALAHQQDRYLDGFWERADVRIDGAPRIQQAVRFALFHLMQAGARAESRPLPGKGLTGPGYEGHAFWDAETFMLPVLTFLAPDVAREALRWRHATLPHAQERARQLHLAGAAFAWRTISGPECSGYWPAGTAAFHVNADIAGAVDHYVRTTGDLRFEREAGLELLSETARLWSALGRFDDRGVFHIDGVTGPDEYSALMDDNVYTNVMAQRNLRAAGAAARRHPERARELGIDDQEIGGWIIAADAMAVPYDRARRVHQQSAGFTERERWDFEGTAASQYPLQAHFPYVDLYRRQVLKQADLVLALQVAPEAFTAEETARAFSYYEELTVRDSSLSASTQAVVAARVGHLALAWDYLSEAAMIDLDDLRGDGSDGVHLAALAGIWTALIGGFGGLRHSRAGLEFAPRLTPPMTRLRFALQIEGRLLRVDVERDRTTYSLEEGSELVLRHFGEPLTVGPDGPVSARTPPVQDPGPAPTQPRGRSPREVAASRGARATEP